MNSLTKFLLEDILEADKKKVTAIYGGGFKPPTKGHYNVVEKAAEQNPEIDNIIIYVGSGERDGITQSESIQIWELYKKYLPLKTTIEPVKAPIGDILRYAKEHPDEEVLWIIGARENNPEDFADIASRTRTIDKYPNLELRVIQTSGGVSGTAARKAVKDNNKEQFFHLIPDIPEKEQVWDIVSPVIKEASDPQAGTALPYGSGFSPLKEGWNLKDAFVSLSKFMIDNGMKIQPLPKIKVIKDDEENASNLLGKTAYYDPTGKSITLYTMNRHPKDILRSFSHEMVHHEQNLDNRLNNINTTNTNEDGDLPEIEREAYEKGNMMLRNWEDSIKNV
jgi:hypothetical protein